MGMVTDLYEKGLKQRAANGYQKLINASFPVKLFTICFKLATHNSSGDVIINS